MGSSFSVRLWWRPDLPTQSLETKGRAASPVAWACGCGNVFTNPFGADYSDRRAVERTSTELAVKGWTTLGRPRRSEPFPLPISAVGGELPAHPRDARDSQS